MEVGGKPHAPAALPPEERAPGTHSIGGWVGLRVGLDAVAKRINPIISPNRNRTPAVQPVS
jgi:hypothetical protein